MNFNPSLNECKRNFLRIIKAIYLLKKNTNQVYMLRAVGLYNPFPQIEAASYYVQQYNHYIESFTSGTFAVANTYDSFRGRERELLTLDRIHPNGRGYRVIADQLNLLGYRPLA
ncbi:Spore germination lipase LipC [compost metagenome]